MIINDPNRTDEQIIREYYERKRQEKAAGNNSDSGNGPANPPNVPKAVSLDGYIQLKDISCIDADGNIFESYPELYVRKNIFRDGKKEIIFLTPYNAIINCEKNELFLPSFALSCNILAALFQKRSDAEIKTVLMQYKDKGNGNGYHAQNTVVNWGARQIIYYPLDSDFPSNGGTSGINDKKRTPLGFDNKEFADKTLEEALKIPNYVAYIKNLTGLEEPSVLVEIGNYFDKTARIWVSSSNETRACWLGCLNDSFLLCSGSNGGVASRGVRKKIP